ncbi:MAG: hypothetical protein IPP88_13985 [Betaproteobacteria bacterium]|nr:hypothetical protein [Betaproteobacteria bacterium]
MPPRFTHRHAFTALLLSLLLPSCAQSPLHDHAAPSASASGKSDPAQDTRPLVKFPEELRIHTLTNMRDHLFALQEIHDALAREQYDRAASVAEQRLGLTSLKLHGAHEVSKYMPAGMQAIGSEMHRAASRFAVAAKDAGATGDVKPALAALTGVTAQCVACHAGFRIQ